MEELSDELKVRGLIKTKLYRLVECAIEPEYCMDRMDNLVYKDGGKKRALEKIRVLLQEFEKEHNVTQEEIRSILIEEFKNISPTCIEEGKEIISILREIEAEQKESETKNEINNKVKESYTIEEK